VVSLGDAELLFQFIKSFGKFVAAKVSFVIDVGTQQQRRKAAVQLVAQKRCQLRSVQRVFPKSSYGLKFLKRLFGVWLPFDVNRRLGDIVFEKPGQIDSRFV